MESNLTVSNDDLEQLAATLARLSADYRDRPEIRAQLDAEPRSFFAARGVDLQAGTELRVVANTADVFHLAMPPNPNAALRDDALETVSGGAPISTIASFPSTISSASSLEDGTG